MSSKVKLPAEAPLINPKRLTLDDWKLEEITEINKGLIDRINKIRAVASKLDPQLDLCLAILYFMDGQYKNSVQLFEKILQTDPNNFSIWNKVAATRAHLGDFKGAQVAYHKALDCKPNYIRSWTNLALNYHSMGKLDQSISFLLNSLALNPNAKHLWSYLESVFIHKKQFEKLKLLGKYQIENFADLHNVKGYGDLPKPTSKSYKQMFQDYALKTDVDLWAESFNQKTKE